MRILIALFLCVQPCLAQFEGVMSMRHTTYRTAEPSTVSFDLLIKKNNAAGSFEGKDLQASGRFILRGDQKVLWVINDQEKSYMEISTESKKEAGRAPKAKDAGLKKTGKSQSLIGYPCDEYLADDEGEQNHIWATAKLGQLYEGMVQSLKGLGGEQENVAAWQRQMMEMRLVPLLVETYRDGALSEKQEVLKIEQKAIPSSTFDAPKGYAKHDISAEINSMYKRMGEKGGLMKDKDFPGMNAEMEKMLKQMQEHEKEKADSADDDDDDDQ